MKCSSCEFLCSAILWGGGMYLASHLLGDAFPWVMGISAIVLWVAAKFIEGRNVAHFAREMHKRQVEERRQWLLDNPIAAERERLEAAARRGCVRSRAGAPSRRGAGE
jgi:hypothetical protein